MGTLPCPPRHGAMLSPFGPSPPCGLSPLGCAVPPHPLQEARTLDPAQSLCRDLQGLPAVGLGWFLGRGGHEGSDLQLTGGGAVPGPHKWLVSSDSVCGSVSSPRLQECLSTGHSLLEGQSPQQARAGDRPRAGSTTHEESGSRAPGGAQEG